MKATEGKAERRPKQGKEEHNDYKEGGGHLRK